MTKLESNIVEINNSQEKIYNFLSDLNNFEKLMPEQVTKWKSTGDYCSFTISGMADLSMSIKEKIPFSKIEIISSEKSPFDFKLNCELQNIKENQVKAQIIFIAELSTMLEMLAKNPLQNLVNILADKLKEIGEKL